MMIINPDEYDFAQDPPNSAPRFIPLDMFIENKSEEQKAEEMMMFNDSSLAEIRDAIINFDMDAIAKWSDVLQRRNKVDYDEAVANEDSEVMDNE